MGKLFIISENYSKIIFRDRRKIYTMYIDLSSKIRSIEFYRIIKYILNEK